MAWSVLQSNVATTSGGNGAATYTSNLSSGTLMVVCMGIDIANPTDQVATCKDTAGNNLTKIKAATNTTDGSWIELYALATPAGNVGTKPTITTTTTNANFGIATVLLEVSGVTATADGTPSINHANATPATNGAYSTSASNEFLIFVYGDAGYNSTASTPAGYTAAAGNQQSNANAQCSAWYKNSTGGSETASSTLSVAAHWGTVMAAFTLSGGGTPTNIRPDVISQARNRSWTF